MPVEKWFTKEERDEIKQVVVEQKMYGWTNEESRQISEKRVKRPVSLKSYINVRAEEADTNLAINWITIQAKAGYLENYKQWMDQTVFIQQRLLRKFNFETQKPLEQQNAHVLDKLARGIRETIMLHASIGLGAPMLLQMKNAIDKGYANEFLDTDRIIKGNQEFREDNTEDISDGEFAA